MFHDPVHMGAIRLTTHVVPGPGNVEVSAGAYRSGGGDAAPDLPGGELMMLMNM